jgi:hypothetical protein
MAIVYFSKDRILFRKDTEDGLYEQVAVATAPDTILFFGSGSDHHEISASTIFITSSRSILADTASYALNGGVGGGGLETGSIYPITSSHSLTSSYVETPFFINLNVDAGNDYISSGEKGTHVVGYRAVLTNWQLIGGETGSISIDLQRSNYSTFPTFQSLTNGSPITASNQEKVQFTPTNWTSSIARGDILKFIVTGSSTLSSFNLIIYGTKYV